MKSTVKPSRTRASNMELLRILAMSAIIIIHFFQHGSNVMSESQIAKLFAYSFTFWGVNTFVMISGYFGIRLKWASFLKLYTLTSLFIAINIIAMFIICAYTDVVWHIKIYDIVLSLLFPFSRGTYWFMAVYFGLFLASPILSKGLAAMSVKELRTSVLVLTLFTVISCGLWRNICNTNGYTFFQFMYMYILGHYVSRENYLKQVTPLMASLLALMCGCADMAINLTVWSDLPQNLQFYGSYNNLFVISQSLFIVVCFANLRIKNNSSINFIASAALGCYLLQDGLVGFNVVYPYLIAHQQLITYISAFCLVWIISMLFTKLKQVMVDPLIDRACPKAKI